MLRGRRGWSEGAWIGGRFIEGACNFFWYIIYDLWGFGTWVEM